MNGQERDMTIRNVKELVNYTELLRLALESTGVDYQALTGVLEALSDHSRSVVLEVLKSFGEQYQAVMDLFPQRLEQHEKNQRWKKVFYFAFKEDLSQKAWENAYREFSQHTNKIEKDHGKFLSKAVAAHSAMVKEGAEAVNSILGIHQQDKRRFLLPGVNCKRGKAR